ncbi:MAG: hypothetical protein JXA43_01280 [Candidatus Diapherotrites archaeon]|nr:hypothetical protein [Candidatus Diapherotrites archaeon]
MMLKDLTKIDYGLISLLLAMIISSFFLIPLFSKPVYSLSFLPVYSDFLFSATFLLLLFISLTLFLAWREHRENVALLSWSFAFFLNSLPFIIAIFDYSLTVISFRFVLVLWAAGLYYGISRILSKNICFATLPTISMIVVAGAWVVLDVIAFELIFSAISLWVFFHLLLTPVLAIITYSFYTYSLKSKYNFPKWLTVGFATLTAVYFMVPIIQPYELMRGWAAAYLFSLLLVSYGFKIMFSEFRRKKRK